MIDLGNVSFSKLKPSDMDFGEKKLDGILSPDEKIVGVYKGRLGSGKSVIFTDKRIIITETSKVKGKTEFTSLPYKQIRAYSVETAGTLDLDSELEIMFVNQVAKFEFVRKVDIKEICQIINTFVL